jgi:hypothetical protein
MMVTDCTNLDRTERKNEMKMINHDCKEQRKPEDNHGYNSNNSIRRFFIKTQVYHVTPVWTNKMPAMAPVTTDTPSTSFNSALHYLLVKQLSCTAVTFLSIKLRPLANFLPIYNVFIIISQLRSKSYYAFTHIGSYSSPQVIVRCGASNAS